MPRPRIGGFPEFGDIRFKNPDFEIPDIVDDIGDLKMEEPEDLIVIPDTDYGLGIDFDTNI